VKPDEVLVCHWDLWHATGRPNQPKTKHDMRLHIHYGVKDDLVNDKEQTLLHGEQENIEVGNKRKRLD